MTPNWKPSRTARKIAEKARKTERKAKEDRQMKIARNRDKVCRFPLCGCKKLGLRAEVSHDQHRGMGGNPKGDRTDARIMVLLCTHRHQFGRISMHAGTLKALPLTDSGYNGPVAWLIDRGEIDPMWALQPSPWWELARETAPGQLADLSPEQTRIARGLASMEC